MARTVPQRLGEAGGGSSEVDGDMRAAPRKGETDNVSFDHLSIDKRPRYQHSALRSIQG